MQVLQSFCLIFGEFTERIETHWLGEFCAIWDLLVLNPQIQFTIFCQLFFRFISLLKSNASNFEMERNKTSQTF